MKKLQILLLALLALLFMQCATRPQQRVVAGCNTNIPNWGSRLGRVSFTTNQTWTIGNQIWSDAVTARNCQKTSFYGGSSSNFNADCRSNPDSPGDLFSWCAVVRFGTTLCPAPWRVPTREDFIALDLALGGTGENRNATAQFVTSNYINRWGGVFGGLCRYYGEMSMIPRLWGHYWSQSESDADGGFSLTFGLNDVLTPQHRVGRGVGLLLRCVRDVE